TRWLRDSGLSELASETGLIGGRLRFALALLLATRSPVASAASPAGHRRSAPTREPGQTAEAVRAKDKLRVAVLRGCIMDGLFGATNRATERVLARNGCELVEAD